MADTAAKRREERIKLWATFLSNLGAATVIASVVGPAITGRFQALAAALGFLSGFVLHLCGQGFLHYVVRDMEEDAGQ